MIPTAQRLDALQHANAARSANKEIRQEIRAGTLTIDQALEDPRAQSMPIGRLLAAQRGWGTTKVNRLLEPQRMWWSRPVRDLTDRQRRVISELCDR